MKRPSGKPVDLPEMHPDLTKIQRDKLGLNFYNYNFLLALEDLRRRWKIQIIDPVADDGWKDTLFNLKEYREEIAYLISLLPSPSYFQDWLIVHFLVFHNIIGIAIPHLENWTDRFRGDYWPELKLDELPSNLTIRIYSQLEDDDWDELKRVANNLLRKLPRKTTHKGDDLTMLTILANLYRDKTKHRTYGMLSSALAELGYKRENGGLFTDDAIDKKLTRAFELGF